MYSEFNISNNNPIVLFGLRIITKIDDILVNSWNKKFICSSDNKDYINSKTKYNFIVDNDLTSILPYVCELFRKYGYTYNIDIMEKLNIEIHYAISNNTNIESGFGIHTDNDNGIKLNTLICYLDVECDGGQLAFYDKSETLLYSIDIHSDNIDEKKIIIFDGFQFHNPLPILNGRRYAISFQFPCDETHVSYTFLK